MSTTPITTTNDGYRISYVTGVSPYVVIACPLPGHTACGYSPVVQPAPGQPLDEQLNANLVALATAELREHGCAVRVTEPESSASDAVVAGLTSERTDELAARAAENQQAESGTGTDA